MYGTQKKADPFKSIFCVVLLSINSNKVFLFRKVRIRQTPLARLMTAIWLQGTGNVSYQAPLSSSRSGVAAVSQLPSVDKAARTPPQMNQRTESKGAGSPVSRRKQKRFEAAQAKQLVVKEMATRSETRSGIAGPAAASEKVGNRGGGGGFSRSASSVSDVSSSSSRAKGQRALNSGQSNSSQSGQQRQPLSAKSAAGSTASEVPLQQPRALDPRQNLHDSSRSTREGGDAGSTSLTAKLPPSEGRASVKSGGTGGGPTSHFAGGKGAETKKAPRVGYQGKVTKVLTDKRVGFIATAKDSNPASEDGPRADVFFHFDRLKFGSLEPVAGDYVSYTLTELKGNKPRASEVRPIKLSPRNEEDLESFCCDILKVVKHPEHEETSVRDRVFDITSPRPVWALLLNSKITERTVDFIVDFVLTVSSMRGLQMYFASFLNNFSHSKFVAPHGPLHNLILRDAELADRFVACLLRNSKTAAGSLTILLSGLAEEAESFFPDSDLCHQIIKHLLSITSAVANADLPVWDIPWNDVPLVPKVHELFGSATEDFEELYPVKKRGSYEKCEYYLDIYFRLLRCDCFAALKAGVKNFLSGQLDTRANVCTYSSVTLKGIQLIENGSGVGLVVQVKADKQPKDWKSAPHLRFGNLVCISPAGNFKDPLWAVVANRDVELLKKEQTTYLELCDPECNNMSGAEALSILLASKRTAMIESPTFYKAFEPVMKALQNFSDTDLPFEEMLVHADFSLNATADNFLNSACLLDASLFFKLDMIASSEMFSSTTRTRLSQASSALNASPYEPHAQISIKLPGADLKWNQSTTCIRMNGGVSKYTIVDPGASFSKELAEYNMAFAQFSRLVEGFRPKIDKIDVYENPVLEANFKAEEAKMAREGISTEATWVFHGTSSNSNIDSIMLDGFKVGGEGVPVANGTAYGRGVYSATSPNTPMGYAMGVRQVILALALKGRDGGISWEPQRDWIVFRSGNQLLPRYVVHFSDCEIPRNVVSVGMRGLVGCMASQSTILSWISTLEQQPEGELSKFTELDRGQLQSVRVALQNRIALIQGPPGTGKTFIGVKLVQMLLSASNFPKGNPILVLTYKNHALDEFLVDCMNKIGTNNVIRVGGRSLETKLDCRNLSSVKKEFQREKALFEAFKNARAEVEESKAEVKERLREFRASFQQLTVDEFLDQAYEPQIESMLKNCQWSVEPCKSGVNKITVAEISKKMEGLGDDCCLQNFLQQDEGGPNDTQEWLIDALERALELWYPAKSVFQNFKLTRVHAPPALLESLDVANQEDSPEFREVDAEDEEPERIASEQFQAWSSEDFVKLDSRKDTEYHDIDVRTICSEAVASGLRQYSALWDLDPGQRACLVCIWMQSARQKITASLDNALKRFSDCRKRLKELQESHEADVLRKAKVVGMTITGAALRAGVLAQVKPSVIIVEEAAEVLEGQIIACLGPWVKRLIMIGDHRQLRPQVACYELVKHFGFDISMFERLIENGMEHGILNTQNRMRPEFVGMLKKIYPSLRSNHSRVDKNVAPACVAKSMFFWSHSDQETPGQSISNAGECERVVALALFFVQQGYSPSQITVLAAYRGQTKMLRDALRKKMSLVWQPLSVVPGKRIASLNGRDLKEEELLKKTESELRQLLEEAGISHGGLDSAGEMIEAIFSQSTGRDSKCESEVAVHTIDQFQGDENDIIIVSLVRSNKGGDIGFLNTINRYCVAVSRARCGVYFVGNDVTLCKKSEHWRYLCKMMGEEACAGIGPAIPLRCPRHPTCARPATKAEDINLEQGICRIRCSFLMPCGIHRCSKPCHADGAQFHDHCMHRLKFRSLCGHDNERKCHMRELDFACPRPCKVPLPCGHPCPHLCGQPCAEECKACIQDTAMKRKQEEDQLKQRMEELLSKAKKKKIGLYPADWDEAMRERYRLRDVTDQVKRRMQAFVDGACNRDSLGRGADQKEHGDYSGLQVIKVERVENLALWRRYRLRYTELLEEQKRLPRSAATTQLDTKAVITEACLNQAWKKEAQLDKDVREHYLFHGTGADTALRIVQDGFEERLANLNGLYGAGAYFAEKSSKSDQYTKADHGGVHRMFVARVLLGAHVLDSREQGNDLRILPYVQTVQPASRASANDSQSVRYSSLLGLAGVHREFVVYDGSQAYPEYLVHYCRK